MTWVAVVGGVRWWWGCGVEREWMAVVGRGRRGLQLGGGGGLSDDFPRSERAFGRRALAGLRLIGWSVLYFCSIQNCEYCCVPATTAARLRGPPTGGTNEKQKNCNDSLCELHHTTTFTEVQGTHMVSMKPSTNPLRRFKRTDPITVCQVLRLYLGALLF